MWSFILRRTIYFIPTMLVIVTLVFIMMRVIPGDPIESLLGQQERDPAQVRELRKVYGLDKPLVGQYFDWIGDALRGDLGRAIQAPFPIAKEIKNRFPVSFEVALLSVIVTAIIGIPVGVLAAVKKNSIIDILGSGFAFLSVSIPSFWLAILLMLLFSLVLGWLPAGGWVPFTKDPIGNLKAMVMPALALGVGSAAIVVRLVRSSMLEVLAQEYVTVARSKGLQERVVVLRHALRNALLPTITVFGLLFGRLISGTVIIESIFGLPGLGKMTLDGIFTREYTMVQAAVVVLVMGVVISNLVVDVLYAYIDPRIRQS